MVCGFCGRRHGRWPSTVAGSAVGRRAAGCVLVPTDDDEQAARVAAESGGRVVAAADAITTECDVYAPCAVGGTLNAESIPRLRCSIVAGSANNQLAAPADADRLREAG